VAQCALDLVAGELLCENLPCCKCMTAELFCMHDYFSLKDWWTVLKVCRKSATTWGDFCV
jgi:hypothetical protein